MLSSHNSLLAALSPTPHPIPPAPLLSHLLATVYPTTQLSLIFIYLSLFNHLSATVPPSHPVPFPPSFPSLPFSLFLLTLSLVLLSHLLKSGSSFLTTGIYLTICLRGLSPLLSTLTSSYATDTIYSLSLLLLLLHLLTHDYFSTSGDGGILSLKSALFATVLLTSRIATTDPDESNYFNCFLFIFVAIQIFCFSPATRKKLSPPASNALALVSISAALFTTAVSSALLFATAVLSLTIASLIAPTWQFMNQSKKEVLCGRWDIAHLAVKDRF